MEAPGPREGHDRSLVCLPRLLSTLAWLQASEQELVAMERERRISEYWLRLNAAHASPKLDVVVLSTKYGAYTWSVGAAAVRMYGAGPPECCWCLPC